MKTLRGYTMMTVVVLGLVLASLTAVLLYATEGDRSEARQQQRSVAALYAAEAAVSIGVEAVRAALDESLTPNLTTVAATTKSLAETAVPGAAFNSVRVSYFNFATSTTSSTPPTSTALQTIATGSNKGLKAQQTPIQVFVDARFEGASASLADAVRIDLIPIFQFALFTDGDLETLQPAAMSINGRVHANGNMWLSNGISGVDFLSKVTIAKTVHSRSAAAASVKVGSSGAGVTRFKKPDGSMLAIANDLPKGSNSLQKSYLTTNYGSADAAMLGDASTGVEPMVVPLTLTSAVTCTSNAACGAGKSCFRARPTDVNGVCTDDVVSRPSVCANSSTASFQQSLAVELIRRPAKGYAGDTEVGPYNDGVAATNVYSSDFGVRAALVDDDGAAARELDDLFEVSVARSVPLLSLTTSDDDPGAVNDRMWWKADVLIIDGVWYRRGSTTPVFDPEQVVIDTSSATYSTDTVSHKFARVLRYSWWWDPRENRVYCEDGAGGNCVTDSKEFHRGAQIRSADFDAAEFMALLDDNAARALLFPSGIPAGGIVVYMSETYDPRFEDASSKLRRAANVRNFLNFPYMHNHLTKSEISAGSFTIGSGASATTVTLPTKVAAAARSTTATSGKTPYELGWYPENIWGVNTSAATHRSLTRPVKTVSGTTTILAATDTAATWSDAYTDPSRNTPASGFDCQISSDLTAAQQPATRPTALATPALKAPCIQSGATPLGAENAVRVVRAQSLPSLGFTFVTDNRLYLHGDVNVTAANTTGTVSNSVAGTSEKTNQDVAGRIAFLADSITIQSEKFDDRLRAASRFDSFHRRPTDFVATAIVPWTVASAAGVDVGGAPDTCSTSVGNISAVRTRVNASLLMGDVPACVDAGDSDGNESGGINNFPRFVEDWSGSNMVINGSIVGLFRAERGNARFLGSGFTSSGGGGGGGAGSMPTSRSSGAYSGDPCTYVQPVQLWSFDDALLGSVEALPPGTPRVVSTDRLRWIRR